jgi:predicted dehydrogenase
MNETGLRVGMVGTGWIATDHLFLLKKHGHRVVAVCDVDRSKAEQAAPAGATVYEAWEALLANEELDALWVATPPLHHRGPTVTALERGIPVYLEKPVARTLEDADAIVEAWRSSGAVCAVGYQWHATEGLEALQTELEGRQLALLWGVSHGPTAARSWFIDRAGGGGNLLERGSHQLDLMRAVAGDVTAVQVTASPVLLAQLDAPGGDIEDAASIVLHFASGAVGSVLLAWTQQGLPGRYSLDVLASGASLHLELDPFFVVKGQVDDRKVKTTMNEHPFERSITRFVDAVRRGDPSGVFCRPPDARATLATALACERSLLDGGRRVELSEVE